MLSAIEKIFEIPNAGFFVVWQTLVFLLAGALYYFWERASRRSEARIETTEQTAKQQNPRYAQSDIP